MLVGTKSRENKKVFPWNLGKENDAVNNLVLCF